MLNFLATCYSIFNGAATMAKAATATVFGVKAGNAVYLAGSIIDWFTPGPLFSLAVLALVGIPALVIFCMNLGDVVPTDDVSYSF